MKKALILKVTFLFLYVFSTGQENFRSGIFLHHSTGGCIWGPNGSPTSVPEQIDLYNTAHGFTGEDAVTMEEAWYPGWNDNEWNLWHTIFETDEPEVISDYFSSNPIIMIKSCFPSSGIQAIGSDEDTLYPAYKTITNYKWHWRHIVEVMENLPENFFVIWTNAPLEWYSTNPTEAAYSDWFCTWAKDTLAIGLDPEYGTFPTNVYVFDFFHKLADSNGFLPVGYAAGPGDSHPNAAATELVAPQLVNEIFDAAIAYESGKILEIKVFLEGPFNGIAMNTSLSGITDFPLTQPYDIAPWNYFGTEQVLSLPSPDIVDWLLIELRSTSGGASTATSDKMIHRQAAFLKSDGSVVGLDGDSLITFTGTVAGNLFILIHHRNHLPVMSSAPATLNGNTYSWDFTNLLSKAYLNGHKQLTTGVFGMIGGDCNADKIISMEDADPYWSGDAGKQGYYPGDVNLDSQVNNPDKNEIWLPNLGIIVKLPWECNSSYTDERDDQIYNTIQIGAQCWMAEHLNHGTMIPGSQDQQQNPVIEKYCYDDLTTNCEIYGALYQWNEVMEYQNIPGTQGICPDSWHIPTDAESEALIVYLGGAAIAGGKLKEAGFIHWDPPNTGATNESGFTALGGGFRNLSGTFQSQKKSTYFWSSTEVNSTNTWYRNLDFLYASAGHYNDSKNYGLGLRCLRDANLPPVCPSDPSPVDGAVNQPVNTILSWSCTDPDNDPLTFDVYFGSMLPVSQVATGQTGTTFDPGPLNYALTYFWKIVAHDDHGNATEGPVWSFTTGTWTCGESMIDVRDGQSYNTVQIGMQCWMAEDMNIGTMVTGVSGQHNNGMIEKFCYGDNSANCDVYGGLYHWNEAMQYINAPGTQGICPEGWHIPADAEWNVIVSYLGGTNVAGAAMKEAGLIHWISPNAGATNSSGYTGLPGGMWTGGSFINLGMLNYVWSSNEFWDPFYGMDIRLVWNNTTANLMNDTKMYGFSVRCLKDNDPPAAPFSPQPPDGAINQSINATLSWSCSDPDNDPLNYDVYFGSTNPPPSVASGQSQVTYNPGTMAYNTTFFWKIVAHDDHGNSTEGPVWSFTTLPEPIWTCGELLIDTRDGQVYNTVLIGTQCWMAENLNIGEMIPGTTEMTNNSIIEKYCYDNSIAHCDVYGGLYQWNEMMEYSTTPGVQGICPESWHLPADEEWTILTYFLGGQGVAGGKMKATGTIEAGTGLWYAPNTGATNEIGFTALPGGLRYPNGILFNMGYYAFLWSSTEDDTDHAWSRSLYYNYSDVYTGYVTKYDGFSVRCIKDN